MIINAILLFLSVTIPALVFLQMKAFSQQRLKYFLVFSGAYLFSVTVIHLIPDVFMSQEDPFQLGLYILIGFFLQKLLENFSRGVEHGHFHAHGHYSATYLLLALGLHSILEGSVLTDHIHSNHAPDSIYAEGGSPKVLLGIIMHKVPAAIALMALLMAQFKKKSKALLLVTVFALASPLGLVISDYISHQESVDSDYLIIFFAIVAGSFLQISTTIFIESDPHHKLDWKKFSVAIIGASAAVIAQLFI